MTFRVPLQPLASRLVGVVAAVALLAVGVTNGWVLTWFSYGVVGALILWHRPGNRIGWLCLAVAGGQAVSGWGQRVVDAAPGAGLVLVEQAAFLAGACAYLSLAAIVAVFPSGRATTRLSRLVWVACCTLAFVLTIAVVVDPRPLEVTGLASPWGISSLEGFAQWVIEQGFVLVPILMFLGLGSLIPRWWASSGIERQQYRWFLLAITFAAATLVAGFGATDDPRLAVLVVGINAVPIALAVAVTRYGLYELDRLISRSASYAIVTGLLLATYALVVTSASRLLGETSTLAVALATLAAAALFQPLLGRVQRLVDRRFNRQRVDHEKAVDEFAARLRDQLDAADTSADLVGVAARTLEPSSTRLWLSGPAR